MSSNHYCTFAAVVLAMLIPTACASSTGTSPGAPGRLGPFATAPIAISGAMSAILVSADGPTADGVFVGSSVTALLREMRKADHGFLSCPLADCWHARQIPVGSIGIAFQANPLGCEDVDSVRVSSPADRNIRLAVQAHPHCDRGAAAAAKGTDILIAVPRDSLPSATMITVDVQIAMRPGDAFKSLGRAAMTL